MIHFLKTHNNFELISKKHSYKVIPFMLCFFVLLLLFPTCSLGTDVNDIARDYVKLVLEVGLYDADYADAYFGPPELKPSEDAIEDEFPVKRLMKQADKLIEQLENAATRDAFSASELPRYNFLKKQLISVKCKIALLDFQEMSFDEESEKLYDIVAPPFNKEHYEQIIKQIDEVLPGEGKLSERIEKYRTKFIVPRDKIQTILTAAIEEYRKRTLEHIKLPADEKLEIESVGRKSWSANLKFNGNSSSVMQINSSSPFQFWDVLTIARHEAYPGHHVYLTMLEKNLYKDKKWIEFSVLPMHSPLALIAEGIAEYGCGELLGIEPENMSFESNTLFPMAGLDSTEAKKYFEIMRLKDELDGAAVEAARKYLDGDMNNLQAHEWLEKYCLATFAGAGTLMNFVQSYRSYIITYSLGQELVKNYIEKNIGANAIVEKKWEIFNHLITSPITPSDLNANKNIEPR
jgi:hypothetical protein